MMVTAMTGKEGPIGTLMGIVAGGMVGGDAASNAPRLLPSGRDKTVASALNGLPWQTRSHREK
jgi:hypothetical protein